MNALPSSLPLPSLPGLWRGQDCLGAPQRVVASGHAALDAELPAGGWPLGALTEVLLEPAAHAEWALVLPALAARLQGSAGRAVLAAPPLEPFTPALQAAGVPAGRLCCIWPHDATAAAWACEQALRCRDVSAVLAWLPQAPPSVLRRLQLVAAQHQQLLWVFRGSRQDRQAASPAPLRLWLERAQHRHLLVHLLKRRGPPMGRPVALPASSALLAEVLAAQARRRQQLQQDAAVLQSPARPAALALVADRHVLAGLAAAHA
ncbi:translesion DNA synthesis-associated protein ImuA [Pulveribacter sp.]|uniref:translesion DNA synthesis-associated protein ImuA n=1 Tax=Pulveribacter sp. TaxID=2678893 RepID=UPI0028A8791D|nr:translesion DNA synthesis-associated protein ImuA [Pulveribacter sp.]